MKRTLILLAAMLTLAGCPGEAVTDAGMDSGPAGDAGPMAPVDLCLAPQAVALVEGANVITGTTVGAPIGILGGDPGAECDNPEVPAPARMYALTIPGTGMRGVSMIADVSAETEDFFGISLQVRGTTCSAAVGSECLFESLFGPAAGGFVVEGGSTIYLAVGEFFDSEVSDVPGGSYVIDVEVGNATAPTLGSLSVVRVDNEGFVFQIAGTDPEGDIAGMMVTFLDAGGTALGYDDDEDPETANVTEIPLGFDVLEGQPAFVGRLSLRPGTVEDPSGDEALLEAVRANAASVRVRMVDAFGLESAEMMVAVVNGTEVSVTQACNATAICEEGLLCTADVCTLPAPVVTACDAASTVTVVGGSTTATQRVTGTVPVGMGVLRGTCSRTPGPELLYEVAVPAGFDLIASTDNDVSDEEGDTVVYIQSACGLVSSEVACNDDGEDTESYLSTAILETPPAATYVVVVEAFGTAEEPTAFALDLSLRPVIGAGAACDPAEVDNRCSTGACPTSGGAVCPPGT